MLARSKRLESASKLEASPIAKNHEVYIYEESPPELARPELTLFTAKG